MKQAYLSKLFLTALLFLSQSMSGLQLYAAISKNIQVLEAGKLSSLITSEEKIKSQLYLCQEILMELIFCISEKWQVAISMEMRQKVL